MNYQAYLKELLDTYDSSLDLELVEMDTYQINPVVMNHKVLILDKTRNYDYRKVIKEFVTYYLMEECVIQNDFVTLHNISMLDLNDYYEIGSNEKICYLDASIPLTSKSETLRRLKEMRVNGKGIYVDDKLVGFIGLTKDQTRASLGYELGYSINENYWNRGIGTKAILALTDYLLLHTPIDILSARILIENEASRHVLLNANFKSEGIRKQSLYHPLLKEIIDTELFSKTK